MYISQTNVPGVSLMYCSHFKSKTKNNEYIFFTFLHYFIPGSGTGTTGKLAYNYQKMTQKFCGLYFACGFNGDHHLIMRHKEDFGVYKAGMIIGFVYRLVSAYRDKLENLTE